MDRIDRIDRIDLTAAGIVHDVALEVLEDDPYPTYAWRPDPDQEATVHGWAVRAAKRLPVVWDP